MLNVLLLGHDGQIGWELNRRLAALGTVRGASYPEVDFAKPDQLRQLVRQVRPGLIVNAAAYTAVDQAEAEPQLAQTVNAAGPALLAEEARKLGALLVHYSTDYVFDGRQRRPYTEQDTPAPLGVYGATKLAGDQAIQASGALHLIFRTALIYGARGKNFLLTVRRVAAEGRTLRMVDDQIGNPTWCAAVAEATAQVLAQVCGPVASRRAAAVSGLYNMTCAGEASRYEFAKACLPPSAQVEPIQTAQYPTPAARPLYSGLDCSRLRQTFGVALPPWQAALQECLRTLTAG
jgi:dTDP-4-dehydrorhamnose reductase